MINRPNHGWSSWQFDNFKLPISYIDDFPFILLNKIIDFFNTEECQEIEFDAEGDFYKIFLGFPVYGMVEKEDDDKDNELIELCDNMVEFTDQLLYDLERDIKDWAQFPTYAETERDILFIEKEIGQKIIDVREAMKKWMERRV